MLLKVIYIIFILSTLTWFSSGIRISQYNETNVVRTINFTLSELKETLQVFKIDFQSLKAKFDSHKYEEESAIKSLREDYQILRAKLEQQQKLVNNKEVDIKDLKTEMEKLKDEKESTIQSLRVKLKVKEQKNEILRTEMERREKCKRQESEKPHNCTEAKSSGVHDILVPKFSSQPFKAACDVESHGGGWIIILRRMDGSVDFYRNWTEYKNGFGNLDGEYFLGLDKIHAMTAERPQKLLVLLEDFEGDQRYETYDEFAIGNEDQQYELHTLGKAMGTAGDSLTYHLGEKFSTFDKDNDTWEENSCAIDKTGAWWYGGKIFACHYSHLTGTYNNNDLFKGVNWARFWGYEYSLKTAIMMIRPKK